jgi:uncharacterized protein YbjT (DUF2867 family)
MSNAPILVIGSTGKTGRRIAARLKALGHTVREGSRQSAIPFDWEKPDTWAPALRGAHSAYISYSPDLGFPGADERIEALTRLAMAAGVRHVVLLSGRNEAAARRCERIVEASGLSHTLVRAAWFNQNFSEGFLRDAVMEGTLAMPAGDVREPFVDVEDIADVAVAALTDPRHAGKAYDLSGPRLLGFAQVAAEISAAAGRPLRYLPVSLPDFHAGMLAAVGEPLAGLFTGLCEEVLDGRNEHLSHGVQQALGRAPRDFADFCRASAKAGVWAETGVAR